MFHHLVALCFSLPALYADDNSTDEQLLVATGRLNDLHALQLVFTAHIVQLLLTAHVNLKSEGICLLFWTFYVFHKTERNNHLSPFAWLTEMHLACEKS